MNAPDYLKLLREKKQEDMPIGRTAQTEKSTLHSLCSSPIAQKKVLSSGTDDTGTPATVASGPAPVDCASENRRARVLAILAANPNVRRAVLVDNADTDPVLLTVAIRDVATFELAVPAARFDAFKLLALIERHRATLH